MHFLLALALDALFPLPDATICDTLDAVLLVVSQGSATSRLSAQSSVQMSSDDDVSITSEATQNF